MIQLQKPHHKKILNALNNFNFKYFLDNQIMFGGGTRIALEINEYRESMDIDFLCKDRDSYRSVRSQVSNVSLGELVYKPFNLKRDIVADRYAVRTILEVDNTAIKLEFVSCDNYQLDFAFNQEMFPVPFLDHNSCCYTKLLANADRALTYPYKDIFDILAMRKTWGCIGKHTIDLASEHYTQKVIVNSLIKALTDIIANKSKYFEVAKSLQIDIEFAEELIHKIAPELLNETQQRFLV